jgi:hypothetical protein
MNAPESSRIHMSIPTLFPLKEASMLHFIRPGKGFLYPFITVACIVAKSWVWTCRTTVQSLTIFSARTITKFWPSKVLFHTLLLCC